MINRAIIGAIYAVKHVMQINDLGIFRVFRVNRVHAGVGKGMEEGVERRGKCKSINSFFKERNFVLEETTPFPLQRACTRKTRNIANLLFSWNLFTASGVPIIPRLIGGRP